MTTPTTERRSISLADAGVQLRAAGEDGQADRFVGLSAVYGVRVPIGDPRTWGFFEEFLYGTFTESLAEDDQRMLIDHDTYYIVSRKSAGDLLQAESPRGIEIDSQLDMDLSYVRDLKVNVQKRRITGMSIAFRPKPDGERWSVIEVEEPRGDGKVEVYKAELRQVSNAWVFEHSAVSFPAFPSTEADLRSAAIERRQQRPELAEQLAGDENRRRLEHPDAARIVRHFDLGRRIRHDKGKVSGQ